VSEPHGAGEKRTVLLLDGQTERKKSAPNHPAGITKKASTGEWRGGNKKSQVQTKAGVIPKKKTGNGSRRYGKRGIQPKDIWTSRGGVGFPLFPNGHHDLRQTYKKT